MVIASSYTSDEEDIYAANDYMNALENNLNYEISNIPNVYVGWNEYNYYTSAMLFTENELCRAVILNSLLSTTLALASRRTSTTMRMP